VREESIEAGGESRTCWVVQVPSRFPAAGPILERSPTTYWIDKVAYVVLKERQSMKMKMPNMDTPHDQTTTITYAIARINEPVADALFRFDPPKGAAEVSEFTSPFGGGSTLVGKRLPEFAMKDLEGREVSSGGLEGKPALIAFWATWCAPCREQMPQIQALHRELAAKGLAVVAVNYGEAAAVARQYLEEHSYTFRALMDGDKSYAGKLSVSSIPVVVLVGSDGVVRAQYTGYNTSIVLRDEVKKIGF
jgi:thiol-disulfide isomerase/thioredoxin